MQCLGAVSSWSSFVSCFGKLTLILNLVTFPHSRYNLTAHAPSTAGLQSDIDVISSNLNLDLPPTNPGVYSPRSEISHQSTTSTNIPPLHLGEPARSAVVERREGESSSTTPPAANLSRRTGTVTSLLRRAGSALQGGDRREGSSMSSTEESEPHQPVAGPSRLSGPTSSSAPVSHFPSPAIPPYDPPMTSTCTATPGLTPVSSALRSRERGMGIEIPAEIEDGDYEPPPTFEEAINYETVDWDAVP